MQHLSLKPPKLTPNDIENLARRFGGKKDDYIEITDKQKNIHTINKYALLKEINDELMATTSIQKE
ncbi:MULTISPECIES: BcsR/BcsP family cellulose biosynthesis protein [Pseudoalteromonas]|jgi:hypothetical protein|uniref:BcsR/BcsP family cellulose biosynthesis protein n=1 Tax=Pseudoalteromonas TaxID=53246 RepID=UPI00110A3AB9|nr:MULTISPECIES: BcsR/BcsP family cellulose biosynthesis protein [Pseudoalteromonas]TMO07371.1 hypothetical protein CWB66_03895 [Pseudoalteromonas sp. S558]